jgi:uncharacterized protein
MAPVTSSRYPLQINAGFLFGQPVGTGRDIHFDLPQVQITTEFSVSDFSGIARLGRTRQGILVQGDFKANITVECVRCLGSFTQPLQTCFDELFAFDKRSATESELILPEDANINLAPLLREYLMLEIPICPICRVDCLGLCSVCGENLNNSQCDHSSEYAFPETENTLYRAFMAAQQEGNPLKD